MTPGDIVLVHLTDHPPKEGRILSRLDFERTHRNTTHLTPNHAVGDVTANAGAASWGNKRVVVFTPLEECQQLNGNPTGASEVDFYWAGSLDINSEKTIVIVQQDDVPKGKLKILSPHEIGMGKNVNVIVLGSSESPYEISDKIIAKMGYTPIPKGQFTWGSDFDILNNPERVETLSTETIHIKNCFKSFCKKFGISESIHSTSSFGRLEGVMGSIRVLSGKPWLFGEVDYKKHLLEVIDDIKSDTKVKDKLPLDIDKLYRIIQDSDMPKNAVAEINRSFGISITNDTGLLSFPTRPNEIYNYVDTKCGISAEGKKVFQAFKEFHQKSEVSMTDVILLANTIKEFKDNQGDDFYKPFVQAGKIALAINPSFETVRQAFVEMITLGLNEEAGSKLIEEKYGIPWSEFEQLMQQLFQSVETIISEMPGYGNKD